MAGNATGRVEKHRRATQALTQADVENRSREISVIKGGDGSNPTAEHYAQAAKEIRNKTPGLPADGCHAEPMAAEPGGHLAVNTGHEIESRNGLR